MKLTLVATALLALTTTGAFAQTINQRKVDQQDRIAQGIRSGQLTKSTGCAVPTMVALPAATVPLSPAARTASPAPSIATSTTPFTADNESRCLIAWPEQF